MKILFLLGLFLLPPRAGAQSVYDLQLAYNLAAAKAKPAVVSVQVVKEETQAVWEPEYFFGYVVPSEKIYRFRSSGLGSGVIIDRRGYVLTNRHVVQDAVHIKVITQDAKGVEKEWPASIVGKDPALDLCLLKIKGDGPFPWLDLSGEVTLKVGDFVLAVGYPFGFKQTVTSGIISALNATLPVEGRKYEKLIQTDAAINHGNSGGPLLNLKGEVIGINTAIASPNGVFAGMGFAVPASEILKVIGDLMSGREVKRGWLGVSLLPPGLTLAGQFGLLSEGAVVNFSAEGSPAHKAGIRSGDILLSCDGKAIGGRDDLVSQLSARRPGEIVELVYLSGGVRKKVKVKLAESAWQGRPEGPSAGAP